MQVFIDMAKSWFTVLDYEYFSKFFDLMFEKFSVVLSGFLNPLQDILPDFVTGFISPITQFIIDSAFGKVPFIAVIMGSALSVILSLHILKLIFEALPIL